MMACSRIPNEVRPLGRMSDVERVSVGAAQRTRLLQEAQGACPFCGLELIGSLQIHHIDRNSANTVDENLIVACGSCHDQLTRRLIPDSQVGWRKQALLNGVHPGRKEKTPPMEVKHTDNRGGVIAQNLNAKNLTIKNTQPSKKQIVFPGSIAESPKHYNYVEYLIKRLTTFRQAGKSFGQQRVGKIHTGTTRSILENQLGGLPKDRPLNEFDDIVNFLKAKIDDTALGRRNRARSTPNYHSFEVHGLKEE